MFVACVYHDRLIHEFILHVFKTLKNSNFYLSKFPKICEMVFEIYENFEQNIGNVNSKNNDKLVEKMLSSPEVKQASNMNNFVILNSKEIIKEKKT